MCCFPLFLGAEDIVDYMWKYDSKTIYDFNYMEDYVAYKYLQSLDISREDRKDTLKFIYFTGKAAAYLDCINASSAIAN